MLKFQQFLSPITFGIFIVHMIPSFYFFQSSGKISEIDLTWGRGRREEKAWGGGGDERDDKN